MGQFNIGDTVRDPESEKTASVIGVTETIRVEWHHMPGVFGVHPASAFELVQREFKAGDFVRIVGEDFRGEVGIVFEDDGEPEDQDPYWVALFSVEGGEEPFSAHELEPWLPLVGERVVEADVEDDEEGTVICVNAVGTDGGVDDVSVRVLWDSYPHAQDWLVADLESVDVYEDEDEFDDGGPYNEIHVGDDVVYANPLFAFTLNANVIDFDDGGLRVRFENNLLPEGNYSKEFFSKAA